MSTRLLLKRAKSASKGAFSGTRFIEKPDYNIKTGMWAGELTEASIDLIRITLVSE